MAKKNNVFITMALAGLMASGAAIAQDKAPTTDAKMGKCYGVAKAGKNDCANKSGSHSCAGQAKKDGDPGDFNKMTSDACMKAGGKFEEMKKPTSK